jgi:hypothetical protein
MNSTKQLTPHSIHLTIDAAETALTTATGLGCALHGYKGSATHESLVDYTVFGVYEGCADRYASVVQARDATEALRLAIEEWHERNEDADVPVRFCGIVKGRHRPLDADYALPGWQRADVIKEGVDAHARHGIKTCEADRIEYSVIAVSGTRRIMASDALEAELQFTPEDVAAVLAGDVLNEFSTVDNTLCCCEQLSSSHADVKPRS